MVGSWDSVKVALDFVQCTEGMVDGSLFGALGMFIIRVHDVLGMELSGDPSVFDESTPSTYYQRETPGGNFFG